MHSRVHHMCIATCAVRKCYCGKVEQRSKKQCLADIGTLKVLHWWRVFIWSRKGEVICNVAREKISQGEVCV